jgi:hypothetical protein
MKVFEFCGMMGVGMLFIDAIMNREAFAKWSNLFATAFGSFIAGMLFVFGWRVLQGGIAALFFGVLLVVFGSGFVFRRARKRAEIASKTR